MAAVLVALSPEKSPAAHTHCWIDTRDVSAAWILLFSLSIHFPGRRVYTLEHGLLLYVHGKTIEEHTCAYIKYLQEVKPCAVKAQRVCRVCVHVWTYLYSRCLHYVSVCIHVWACAVKANIPASWRALPLTHVLVELPVIGQSELRKDREETDAHMLAHTLSVLPVRFKKTGFATWQNYTSYI